jgi:putative transposase
VLAQCQRRHRHQEFLGFLERIDASVPADLDVHLVIDNYATHKHAGGAGVARGAAPLPRPLHAYLRLVAQPGGAVVRPRHPARDPPASVRTTQELVRRIEAFVAAYNATARPFAWTATSEVILANLERLLKAMSGSQPQDRADGRATGGPVVEPPVAPRGMLISRWA